MTFSLQEQMWLLEQQVMYGTGVPNAGPTSGSGGEGTGGSGSSAPSGDGWGASQLGAIEGWVHIKTPEGTYKIPMHFVRTSQSGPPYMQDKFGNVFIVTNGQLRLVSTPESVPEGDFFYGLFSGRVMTDFGYMYVENGVPYFVTTSATGGLVRSKVPVTGVEIPERYLIPDVEPGNIGGEWRQIRDDAGRSLWISPDGEVLDHLPADGNVPTLPPPIPFDPQDGGIIRLNIEILDDDSRPIFVRDVSSFDSSGGEIRSGWTILRLLDGSTVSVQTMIGTSESNFLQGAGLILGDAGDDTIVGNWQGDILRGGTGSDVLNGREGADILDGGDGFDYANYWNSGEGVFVSLTAPHYNTGHGAGDVFISIEGLEGSQHDDTLVGDTQANVLRGFTGDDTLNGHDGADTLDGGAGTDIADYFNATSGVTASLANPAANTGQAAGDVYLSIEGLSGSQHADALSGDDGSNHLMGLAGNDVLAGHGGNDALHGGEGDDCLIGGEGADLLNGGAGFDTVEYVWAAAGVVAHLGNAALNTGDAAGDTYVSVEGLTGSYHHSDRLTGNAGDNAIYGLGGHDVLSGGGGHDRLYGGAGWDVFQFDAALGSVSVLADFNAAEDVMHLSRAVFSAAGAPGHLAASAFQIGSHATTAQHRIVYNQATGDVFYDADGTGWSPMFKFAQVNAGTALTTQDFWLF